MRAKLLEQLSSADAEVILERLPKRIRDALITRATKLSILLKQLLRWQLPVSSMQRHVCFADCKPERGQ